MIDKMLIMNRGNSITSDSSDLKESQKGERKRKIVAVGNATASTHRGCLPHLDSTIATRAPQTFLKLSWARATS